MSMIKYNFGVGKIKKHITILYYWLIFILVTVYQLFKLKILMNHLNTNFPETLGYDLRLETAQLVMIIAFYLMLSTIIIVIKDEKIKACYYILAIALIIIAYPLIEKYYYLNSVFTKYEGYYPKDIVFSINFGMVWNPRGSFFNPSLLPLLISIVILIIPLISKYLKSINED